MSVPEVRALLIHVLEKRRRDEDDIPCWSAWRQERNRIAKQSHRKRRRADISRRGKP
jgi:hypothetical protein